MQYIVDTLDGKMGLRLSVGKLLLLYKASVYLTVKIHSVIGYID